MVHSIIKKSQLEGAKRLDAEYYQPEYLSVREKLLKSPTLDQISRKVTDFGAYSQMNFVEYTDVGVRFLRNQDVGDVFIKDNEQVFISEDTYKMLTLKLEEGDIVTPRVGTLGNAAVVFKNQLPASANQNLAQIKPNQEEVDPIYLAVFLSSKFGRNQFQWLATGNVQPWLNLSQINLIKVFLPPSEIQTSVAKVALEAKREFESSISLYSQAENLLLEKLGLENFERGETLSWTVNLADVKTANRMDAEYFQPKYEKLRSNIKSQKSKLLPEVIENVPAKFDPSSKPDQSFKYVELSNINSSIGIIDGFSEVMGKEAPSRAKRILKPNDVIVSSVEGSLEKVALVGEEQEGHLASTGFFQLRSKELLPEVLLVLAKSPVFQMQLQKHCAGTILTAVPKEAVNKIVVPNISNTVQQKIAELVRQSHKARKQSKQLLAEAKRKVEEAIEQ